MAALDFKELEKKVRKLISEAKEAAKAGRCLTCRHWLQYENDPSFLHYCGSPKMIHIASGLDGIPEFLPDGSAADGEAYGGTLYTGPEFGCVNFEPIETKEQ